MAATLLAVCIPCFEAVIRKAVDSGLRSRPVAIVSAFTAKGRVITACPQARHEGIHDEMYYPAAKAICPDAVFLPPDKHLSAAAMGSLIKKSGQYSPLVASAGNGRILVDARGTERLWGDSHSMAARLQKEIEDSLDLPAAAGLSSLRPWSLLASRAACDHGLYCVETGKEEAFLDAIPVEWVDGVDIRSRTLLAELNIRTIGQLRQFSQTHLVRHVGRRCADALWQALHPHPWEASFIIDPAPREGEGDCLRLAAVLAETAVAADKLDQVVVNLAADLSATLRQRNQGTARMKVILLYADGVVKAAQDRTGGYIQDENSLIALARRLFHKAMSRRVRISRIWLEAEKLAEPARQASLFPPPAAESINTIGHPSDAMPVRQPRQPVIESVVDDIRHRFGDHSVIKALQMEAGKGKATARLPRLANRKVS